MSAHRVVSMTAYKPGSTPHPARTSSANRSTHKVRPGREWQETWADYASHTGTAARQRIKLVAKGLASRLQETAKDVRLNGRRRAKKIGLRAALLASHKLVEIASRIERRVKKLQDSD